MIGHVVAYVAETTERLAALHDELRDARWRWTLALAYPRERDVTAAGDAYFAAHKAWEDAWAEVHRDALATLQGDRHGCA